MQALIRLKQKHIWVNKLHHVCKLTRDHRVIHVFRFSRNHLRHLLLILQSRKSYVIEGAFYGANSVITESKLLQVLCDKKNNIKKNKKMKQQKLEFNFLIFRTAFGQYPGGSDFRRKKKNLIDLIA